MVNDILAEKYTLVESMDNFTNTQFYVAVFANDSCVCFAVDAEQYLYIESVSGIQSLACNK